MSLYMGQLDACAGQLTKVLTDIFNLLQDHVHRASTEILSCYEVLREADPGSPQKQPTTHTGPFPVHLPPE